MGIGTDHSAPLASSSSESIKNERGGTFGVEEALEAVTGAGVAVARSRQIDVVVALARPAATARHVGIAKVIVGADVAARTGVALLALAHHVLIGRRWSNHFVTYELPQY